MRLRFTTQIDDFFPTDNWDKTPEIAGLAMRTSLEKDGTSVKDILMVLPCGHRFRSQGEWDITGYDDNDKITLTPSILCYGLDGSECWHGYIKDGELVL